MKTLKMTLENDFHNTAVTAIAKIDAHDCLYFSHRQAKRIKTALCGHKGCWCPMTPEPSGPFHVFGGDHTVNSDRYYAGRIDEDGQIVPD